MSIGTTGVCSHCKGHVGNIARKRHSMERLTEIHDETCPAVRRVPRPS